MERHSILRFTIFITLGGILIYTYMYSNEIWIVKRNKIYPVFNSSRGYNYSNCYNPKVEVNPSQFKNVCCDSCFVRNYTYLNKPNDICDTNSYSSPDLDMIIAIPSEASRRYQRDLIRQTWASISMNNTSPAVRHVFLLGVVPLKNPSENNHTAANMQDLINRESQLYNDIVQQNFNDVRMNLTLKTLMLLDWVNSYCYTAKYILKIDQDVFINVQNVLKLIKESTLNTDKNLAILGKCSSDLHIGPHRDPKTKYHITYEMYPQEKLPPLCYGPRYLIPQKLVKPLLEVAPDTPYLAIEDGYLGLLLAKTGYNVKNVDIDKGDVLYGSSCTSINKAVTKHEVPPITIIDIWKRCFNTTLS